MAYSVDLRRRVVNFVGSGGRLILSGALVSGQYPQRVGTAISGGVFVNVFPFAFSGVASTI